MIANGSYVTLVRNFMKDLNLIHPVNDKRKYGFRFWRGSQTVKILDTRNCGVHRVHFIVTEAYLSTSRDILSYLVKNFL